MMSSSLPVPSPSETLRVGRASNLIARVVRMRSSPAVAAAASPLLAVKLDIRMAHTIVSSERIRTAELLVVGAKVAAHFLFPSIVDSVLVAGEVVGPREDRVAWLAGAWVDPVTAVGTSLAVEQARSHANAHTLRSPCASKAVSLPVAFPLVLLKKRRCLEAQSAAVICACVCAAVCARYCRPLRAVAV